MIEVGCFFVWDFFLSPRNRSATYWTIFFFLNELMILWFMASERNSDENNRHTFTSYAKWQTRAYRHVLRRHRLDLSTFSWKLNENIVNGIVLWQRVFFAYIFNSIDCISRFCICDSIKCVCAHVYVWIGKQNWAAKYHYK